MEVGPCLFDTRDGLLFGALSHREVMAPDLNALFQVGRIRLEKPGVISRYGVALVNEDFHNSAGYARRDHRKVLGLDIPLHGKGPLEIARPGHGRHHRNRLYFGGGLISGNFPPLKLLVQTIPSPCDQRDQSQYNDDSAGHFHLFRLNITLRIDRHSLTPRSRFWFCPSRSQALR